MATNFAKQRRMLVQQLRQSVTNRLLTMEQAVSLLKKSKGWKDR